MQEKCSYKLRLGHGSNELLIEFAIPKNPKKFMQNLASLLTADGFLYKETKELWMNEEIVTLYTSRYGKIEISIDFYDIVFIMSSHNEAILRVDFLLRNTELYEKEK